MLQIVKDGKTAFLGFCKKCGCEFSYDLADLHNGPGGALYVQCPCCEYVYHHPDQDQDFTIFGPPYTSVTTIDPLTIDTPAVGPFVDTPAIGPFVDIKKVDFGNGITGELTSINSKPGCMVKRYNVHNPIPDSVGGTNEHN